jgi:hypothetical protein
MITEVSSNPRDTRCRLDTRFYVLGHLSVEVLTKLLGVERRSVLKRLCEDLDSNEAVPSKRRQ